MNVIVTGASKGIGRELVRIFAADERVNTVFALSRDAGKLSKFKNPKIKALPFDLTSGNFKMLVGKIKAHAATIDALVNNAGTLVNKAFEKISAEELRAVYESNVFGAFRLTQAMLPLLKRSKHAHVLNISSMGGFQGSAKFKGLSAYSSSKGALAILSECLAEELREKNISVNCLCLGAVQTEMLNKAFPGYKAPLNAKQMAGFIADFTMNGHRYFNGKILPVSLSTP